jgi:hypothetical protein
MAHDDTFWGGLGQWTLVVLAALMGVLTAAPALLLLATPFIL